MTATLKPDWNLPVPPQPTCQTCGEPLKPVAYLDFDEWSLGGFDCDNLCESVETGSVFDWPFVEDYATREDVAAAGFLVV